MSRRRKPKTGARLDEAVKPRDAAAPFGRKLRAQREARGFTLAQVAKETKIGLRYLEALERGDFESLPGGVFNRGFVRAIAQFIGVDPEGLVRDFAREEESRGLANPDTDLAILKATLERQAPTRHWGARIGPALFRAVVVGGIVAGVAAFAGWSYVRNFTESGGNPALLGPELAWNVDPTEVGTTSETSSDASAAITTARVDPAALRHASAAAESATMDDSEPSTPVHSERDARAAHPPDPAADRREIAEPLSGTDPSARPEPPGDTEIVPPPPDDRPEPSARTSRLSISDFGVGARVVNHQLRGRADRFTEGEDVWFWTRVLGGEPGQRILHVWLHDGRPVGSSELRIGGSHWRTQSRRSLLPGSAGEWTVEARDLEGRTLAVTQFVCEPADSAADSADSP